MTSSRSANEEIMSSNEELQSTNEAAETAKEELQSVNEELQTINDELQNRNTELNGVNNDLKNVISSVRIPVIIVGRDLCIRRFTPGADKLLKLIPSDVGRSIGDIKTNVNILDLIPLISQVIESGAPVERQVRDAEGRWLSLWVGPYKTMDNKVDGAVITLFDIDALRRSRDFATTIVQTVRESLLVLDQGFRVQMANRSFYETFRTLPRETEGKSLFTLGDGQWDIPLLRSLLEKVLPEKSEFENEEVTHDFPGIGRRSMVLNARKIKDDSQTGNELVLLAIQDATERKTAELSLKEKNEELLQLNVELEQFAYVASHDLQEPLRMVSTYLELLSKTYRGKLDKEADEFINIAVSNARRMKALVGDLLAFSRTGREELQCEPTDCSRLVDGTIKYLKQLIEESGAEIRCDPLPTILANGALLGLVFQNLITNAVKFHDDKVHPKIHVSAEETTRSGSFRSKTTE